MDARASDPGVFELLVRRSRRRVHRGGRLFEGKTQGIFARLQFEHGDCLSQRTLRLRHIMQLRGFGVKVSAMEALPSEAELAPFSRSGADPEADIVDAGASDMVTPIRSIQEPVA